MKVEASITETVTDTSSNDNVPSWLQPPTTETSIVHTVADETPHLDEETDTVVPITETAVVPSWLQVGTSDTDSTSDTTVSTIDSMGSTEVNIVDNSPQEASITPELPSDALPDWLVDSLKSSENIATPESSETTTPVVEKKKKSPKKSKKEDT